MNRVLSLSYLIRVVPESLSYDHDFLRYLRATISIYHSLVMVMVMVMEEKILL